MIKRFKRYRARKAYERHFQTMMQSVIEDARRDWHEQFPKMLEKVLEEKRSPKFGTVTPVKDIEEPHAV